MANNSLSSLNNHLFAQLERLGDEDITPEKLLLETERTKSMQSIARMIVDNAKVVLEGEMFKQEYLPTNGVIPDQFKISQPEQFKLAE